MKIDNFVRIIPASYKVMIVMFVINCCICAPFVNTISFIAAIVCKLSYLMISFATGGSVLLFLQPQPKEMLDLSFSWLLIGQRLKYWALIG